MKKIDGHMTDEFFVSNVTTVSGLRPSGKGSDFRIAGRQTHGLVYLRTGEACFQCNKEPALRLSSGEVLYIPKHQKYKMQYTAQQTDFLLVNFDLFDANGEELSIADGITLVTDNGIEAGLERIMREMDAHGLSRDFSSMLRRKELMYRLLRMLFAEKPSLMNDVRSYPQIAAGTRLLEQLYSENIPIARFAKESNISLSSFRSLFVKQYGISPVQYRNRLRLEHAERLLSEGTYTVSEVAYACGFENIGYFCRYYKKVFGIAPGEIKKRSRE